MLPSLDAAIDFALTHDLSALPLGRTEIDGDSAYVLMQEPALKPEADARWECHDEYADVQLGLAGGETIAYLPRESVQAWAPHKPDVYKSADAAIGVRLPLSAGRWALFLPQDAHKPGIGEGVGRKAVFKLRCK